MKVSYFSIFSSLNNSLSSSSESFSPRLVITFLNYLTVMVDPLGLKIDCMASMSSSSAYGSLYSLHHIWSTLPWGLRNRRIRTCPCCLDRPLCSIQRVQLRLGFGLMIEPREVITKQFGKTYPQGDKVVVIFVEELERLLEFCDFLFTQLITLIHFIFNL